LDARVTAAEQAIEALLVRAEAAEHGNIRLQERLALAEHRAREAEARAQRAEQKVHKPDGVKEWIAGPRRGGWPVPYPSRQSCVSRREAGAGSSAPWSLPHHQLSGCGA
jgi:hypothetical protein